MMERFGAETTESSLAEIYQPLQEWVARRHMEKKEGKPLPGNMKTSLKKALAVLGMGLMLASPETLMAQSPDGDGGEESAGASQAEVYSETAYVKGEGRKDSLVVDKDVSVGDKQMTLTGSMTYGGSV